MLWLDGAWILLGVALLTVGAGAVVQGGAALARRIGISPLWVGLTVVALGTSAPEIVVSVMASVNGNGGIALGNVVGSNILNILIVLGLTALVVPVAVQQTTVRRDIFLVTAVSLGILALAADGVLHRGEGLLLLGIAVPYTFYVYQAEKKGYVPVPDLPHGLARRSLALQVGATVVGIAMLIGGGQAVLKGAVSLAAAAGLSDRVVGLTIVAVGTSLPELATSIMAAMRRQVDLAIGNIVGSNLLNMTLALGGAAAAGNILVGQSTLRLDLPAVAILSLLLWRFASTHNHVSRIEGGALVGAYAAYVSLVLLGVAQT